MKVLYEGTVIAEVTTNRSLTVWEALEVAGIDMDQYAKEQGWEAWDPEDLEVEYES